MDEFLAWEGWRTVTGVAATIGLFACVLFVARFHTKTGGAWWRHPDGRPNPFGRFLFFRKALLSALFLVVILNRVLPGWEAQDFVTALVFLAFAVQTFVPYRLLLQAQKDIDDQEARQL